MYRTSAVKQVYDDYLKILEASERITVEQCRKISWTKRFLRGIIRAFAPLM